MNVLFFKAIGRKAIWGHTRVRDYFHYDWFPEGIGQSWSFACQEGSEKQIYCLSEPFAGKTLNEIWEQHPELFGNPEGEFPVIISLVGPEEDLSIQVHPDDERARKIGYSMGKNEAWYVIDTVSDSTSIVYGNNCADVDEMRQLISENRWNEIFRYRKTGPGDFVYLPAGILHAMGKDHIMYEIQQSTDVTYRLYDYDRVDSEGKKRELHLQKGLDCVGFGEEFETQTPQPITYEFENRTETVFISCTSFTVTREAITGDCNYICSEYQLATVVKGEGTANGIEVSVGDNFLIPVETEVHYTGNMEIMMTTKEKKYFGR